LAGTPSSAKEIPPLDDSEITVEHRETIGEEALKALIVESFKNSIDLGEAYDRREVYQRRKPVSICAFESGPTAS
jgi:hypothetical protein